MTVLAFRVYFEPRDLWVGVFWRRPVKRALQIYICPLPTLVVYLSVAFPVAHP